MHRCYVASLIPFVLLSLHTSFTHAIISENVISLVPHERYFLDYFVFTSNGYVSFNISSVTTTTSDDSIPPSASRIGLYLAPFDSYKNRSNFRFRMLPNISCLLDNPMVTVLSTLSDTFPLSKTISINEPGSYQLAMKNCARDTYASLTVHTEVYNVEVNGDKNHLSDGLTHLPMMFLYLSGTYAFLFIVWLLVCLSNKPHVKQIHILMMLLLVVSALNSLFAAGLHYNLQIWGVGSRWWDLWYWGSDIVKEILFFVVIALMGTGWCWLRPFLKPREKLVLVIGIPLQVLGNIATNVLDHTRLSSHNMFYFGSILTVSMVSDLICCGLIMLPALWSYDTLRSSRSSKMEGRAAPTLKRLKLFWNFSGLVCSYLLLKRVALFMLHGCTLSYYKSWWWNDACREGLTLMFYIVIFFLFRPRSNHGYFVLSKNEEEEKLALEAIDTYWKLPPV